MNNPTFGTPYGLSTSLPYNPSTFIPSTAFTGQSLNYPSSSMNISPEYMPQQSAAPEYVETSFIDSASDSTPPVDERIKFLWTPINSIHLLNEAGAAVQPFFSSHVSGSWTSANTNSTSQMEGTQSTKTGPIACYRRNMIGVTGHIHLATPIAYMRIGSEQFIVSSLCASLKAVTLPMNNGDPEEAATLKSIPFRVKDTKKADDGTFSPPRDEVLHMTGQGAMTFNFSWDRLVFSGATINNGRAKTSQRYNALIVKLYGLLPNGTKVLIGEARSNNLIVRGRSPKNFAGRNEEKIQMPPSKNEHGKGKGVGQYENNGMSSSFLLKNSFAPSIQDDMGMNPFGSSSVPFPSPNSIRSSTSGPESIFGGAPLSQHSIASILPITSGDSMWDAISTGLPPLNSMNMTSHPRTPSTSFHSSNSSMLGWEAGAGMNLPLGGNNSLINQFPINTTIKSPWRSQNGSVTSSRRSESGMRVASKKVAAYSPYTSGTLTTTNTEGWMNNQFPSSFVSQPPSLNSLMAGSTMTGALSMGGMTTSMGGVPSGLGSDHFYPSQTYPLSTPGMMSSMSGVSSGQPFSSNTHTSSFQQPPYNNDTGMMQF